MNKGRTIGLTAAALVACAAPAAAATITQTRSFGPAAVTFTHNFSFTGFDTSLGTLTSLTDTLTESFTGSIDLKNNTGTNQPVVFANITNIATKSFGTALTLSTTSVGVIPTTTVLGPGATTTVGVSGTGSTAVTATTGLSFFETATVAASATDSRSFVGSNSALTVTGFTDNGTITDKLVYTYTPNATVPEPSSLALLASALLGLGFVRRRRRRAPGGGPTGPRGKSFRRSAGLAAIVRRERGG